MKILTAFFFTFIIQGWAIAQDEIKIKRSEVIETIGGQKYYLHFIKQGETLYQLSQAYEVSTEEIIKYNSESASKLEPGKILKIPYSGNLKQETSQPPSAGDYFLYTVKNKETLYGISKKFGVEIQQILKLNPETGNTLKEGQTIKLPSESSKGSKTNQEPEGKTINHTVQPGETLYSISKKYNITLAEIEKANPGITGAIKTGQVLVIPLKGGKSPDIDDKKSQTEGALKKHTVATGETIYSISREYSVETDSIYKLNPGLTENIFVGQVLNIPNAKKENFIWHKAEKNDKLQNIAEKYNVSYSDILDANPGIQKKVEKGQLIKIPVGIQKSAEEIIETSESVSEKDAERNCGNADRNRHNSYEVALMIPLYLEQTDSLTIDSLTNPKALSELPPMKFLQFYEGFKLAVDSISKAGMKLSLYVYDVDNSSEKINAALNNSELDKMDLIIGPFYSESFKKMAAFAKTKSIKIVNPLSTREEILIGNPNVFKIKPAVSSQSGLTGSFILRHYSKSNIIIIRQNRYKFQEEVSFIKNYLNGHRPTGTYLMNRNISDNLKSRKTDRIFSENNLFTTDRLNARINDSTYISNMVREIVFADDSNFKLKYNLSSVRHNLVVVYSDEKVFSQELMSQMNKLADDYDISLFGCPDWEKFEDLETDQLVNLNVHWLTPALVNYNDPGVKQWIIKFRSNFHTEPTIKKYAFEGFDIGWYFLNALFRYGNEFERCLDDYHPKLMHNTFEFEQLRGNGFENTFWNIGAFEDFRFVKAGK